MTQGSEILAIRRLRRSTLVAAAALVWLAACESDPAAVADASDTGDDTVAPDVAGTDVETPPEDIAPDLPKDVPTGLCAAGPAVCDDGNPCTVDECDPVHGCSSTLKFCVPDGDNCTVDGCDMATGNCTYTLDTCEDGNACTVGTCTQNGGCAFEPANCDDGDACTADGCTPAVGCQTSAVSCDDGLTCTVDSCDKTSGCKHDKPPGAKCCETVADCDDGSVCTVDTCNSGVCTTQGVAGCCATAADCDDANPCTLDNCNAGSGLCGSTFSPGPGCCTADADCDDGNSCTLDRCFGNACAHETKCCTQGADCGAGEPAACATPVCTTAGCAVQAKAGAGCCTPQVAATGFESGDKWTVTVAPALLGAWTASVAGKGALGSAGLVYESSKVGPLPGGGSWATARLAPITLPAGVRTSFSFVWKGSPGQGDQIRVRAITSMGSWILWTLSSSADWQTVTLDLTGFAARAATREVRLVFEVVPNGAGNIGSLAFDDVKITSPCSDLTCVTAADCDDKQAATTETCSQGRCVFQTQPEYCESTDTCDDANSCTTDQCVSNVCQHPKLANCCLNAKDCDDGNVCTLDNCAFKKCKNVKLPATQCCAAAVDCDDGNLCTQDLCPTVGLPCAHTQTDANCCVGVGDCNDQDACTVDACTKNQCKHKNQCCATAADCNDGDDVCTTETCVSGDVPGGLMCQWTKVKAPGCCEPEILVADFEAGLGTQLTLQNAHPTVKWQTVLGKRAHGGTGALYYGNPDAGNYSGASTTGTVATTPLTLPEGEKLTLSFWLYMDTESGTSYDSFLVRVLSSGGPPTQVWAKNSPGFVMKSWFEATIDLAKWAGQTVTIQFVFDSMDEVANETEGVYLDDLSITRSCAPSL
jgi:hypothetical protein